VSLPPLVTPAGTSITLGPGPGQPAPINPATAVPVTNGPAAITNGSSHTTSSPRGQSVTEDEEVSALLVCLILSSVLIRLLIRLMTMLTKGKHQTVARQGLPIGRLEGERKRATKSEKLSSSTIKTIILHLEPFIIAVFCTPSLTLSILISTQIYSFHRFYVQGNE
jgi:hypothetical protein